MSSSLSSLSNPRTFVSLASGLASFTDIGLDTYTVLGEFPALCCILGTCLFPYGVTSLAPYGVTGLAPYGVTGLVINLALASLELLADFVRDLHIAGCVQCTGRPASRYSCTYRPAT